MRSRRRTDTRSFLLQPPRQSHPGAMGPGRSSVASGARPTGVWLPETAADRETLEVLAEEGVRFTLLAPAQAAGVREPGGRLATGRLDPRRAYRWEGSARPRAGALLLRRTDLPRRGLRRAPPLGRRAGDTPPGRFRRDAPSHPQLVQIATDGETSRPSPSLRGDGAGRGLRPDRGRRRCDARRATPRSSRRIRPRSKARVVDGSSWSCAHGVERWRADCGCRAGRHHGWDSALAGVPCGEALDWLRDTVDPLYEARAAALVKDPWAARDAYVAVPPRSDPRVRRRPSSTVTRSGPLDADGRVQALRCLELQRHRLLMYTSCGWFFDEISGIETVQVLRYAARVLQLARAHRRRRGTRGGARRRPGPRRRTLPELRDGAGVWRRARGALRDRPGACAAHYAIAGPTRRATAIRPRSTRSGWSGASGLGWWSDDASLSIGRVRVTARVTDGERGGRRGGAG